MLLAETPHVTEVGKNLVSAHPCLEAWEIDTLEVHIQSRLNGRVRNLRLVCQQGALVIQGQAFSYYVKQLAQHAVMEAITVPSLINDIVVE